MSARVPGALEIDTDPNKAAMKRMAITVAMFFARHTGRARMVKRPREIM